MAAVALSCGSCAVSARRRASTLGLANCQIRRFFVAPWYRHFGAESPKLPTYGRRGEAGLHQPWIVQMLKWCSPTICTINFIVNILNGAKIIGCQIMLFLRAGPIQQRGASTHTLRRLGMAGSSLTIGDNGGGLG